MNLLNKISYLCFGDLARAETFPAPTVSKEVLEKKINRFIAATCKRIGRMIKFTQVFSSKRFVTANIYNMDSEDPLEENGLENLVTYFRELGYTVTLRYVTPEGTFLCFEDVKNGNYVHTDVEINVEW